MTRSAYIALLFAVPVLAVAGCGGGDSASETSAARGATGQQDTTSTQTGTSGATGTTRARPKRAAKSKQRPDRETGADESNAGTPTPAAPTARKQKPQPRTLSPEELKEVATGMHEQARLLCKAAGLEGLAQQYNIKSGDPDEVAEAYAADYLVGLREAVAAGCKAGLLESK